MREPRLGPVPGSSASEGGHADFAARTEREVRLMRDLTTRYGRAEVEHVGLGGDFDGTPDVTVGLEDVSTYPALFAELARRGWTEPDCAALAGGNVLRALRSAEAFAAAAR